MKKLVGFALFWIAVGMIFMLFLRNGFLALLIIVLLLVLGYNLFNNC